MAEEFKKRQEEFRKLVLEFEFQSPIQLAYFVEMRFVSSALDHSTLMRTINIFLVPIKAMPNFNLSKLPFIL